MPYEAFGQNLEKSKMAANIFIKQVNYKMMAIYKCDPSIQALFGSKNQNGFTRSTFRGMPSFVPKFAFLVPEIGLRNPPI